MPNGQLPAIEPVGLLPELPTGWEYALVSGYDETLDEWAYIAKERINGEGSPVEVARISGCFFTPVPTEPETATDFVDGLKKKFTNPEGQTRTVNGTPAAAFKVAYDKHESVRGLVRKEEIVDAEGLNIALYDNAFSTGRKPREVSTEAIEAADTPEKVEALMKRLGVKVTS